MDSTTAQLFAREGARVSIVDIQETAGVEAVEAIRAAVGEAFFFHADVSKADQVDRAIDAGLVRQGLGPSVF